MSTKDNNQNIHDKPEISSGHDIALTSIRWFCVAFLFLINFGSKPMKEFRKKKYNLINFWIKFCLKIVFLALILYLMWHWSF